MIKYVYVGRIDSASVYDFAIIIWNCSDSVLFVFHVIYLLGRRGSDRMVGGFTTTCATSFEFKPR